MKWIPLALVLIGGAAGLYVAVGATAERSLQAYRREVEADLTQEQAAAARRPVLWGKPVDCEAMGRYQRVFRAAERWDVSLPLYDRLTAAAQAQAGPLPEAAGLLQRHRLALQELREGTTCARVERQPGVPEYNLPQARLRLLGAMLVLEGDALAPHDGREAARRYLAAVRLGSDVAEVSFAAMGLAGGAVMAAGLGGLVRLTAGTAAGDAGLRTSLRQAQARMAPLLPGSARALRQDRLQITAAILALASGESSFAPVVLSGLPRDANAGYFALAPVSLYCSQAVHAVDGTFRAAEITEAGTQRQTLRYELRDGAAAPWNPILLQIAPNYLAALEQADQVAARFEGWERALHQPG